MRFRPALKRRRSREMTYNIVKGGEECLRAAMKC